MSVQIDIVDRTSSTDVVGTAFVRQALRDSVRETFWPCRDGKISDDRPNRFRRIIRVQGLHFVWNLIERTWVQLKKS